MRTLAIAAAVLACALGLTACTDGDVTSPSPTPTATTESPPPTPSPAPTPTPLPTPSPTPTASSTPSPSPSPTAADVPDDLSTIADDGEVTLAEAQAVIDVQNQILDDAIIDLITRGDDVSGGSGAEFNAQLARIYNEGLLGAYGELWNQIARDGFQNFNTSDPTGTSETVLEVLDTRQDCFEVQLERNQSGLAGEAVDPATNWTALRSAHDGPVSNPSGWYRDIELREERTSPLCELEVTE